MSDPDIFGKWQFTRNIRILHRILIYPERGFSKRLKETMPKALNDKGEDDFPDLAQSSSLDREVGWVESGHYKSVNEPKRRQLEAEENEGALMEKENTYSIFVTVAPMLPRQARCSLSK